MVALTHQKKETRRYYYIICKVIHFKKYNKHYANPQMCIYLILQFISNVCGQLITLKGSCVGACINATHIILKEPSAS